MSNQGSQPFLTVVDAFELERLGLIVAPDVSPEAIGSNAQGHKAMVELLRPDGSQELLEATFYWEHARPGGYRYVCTFASASKEQVPPGTRLWLSESDAP